MIVVGFRNLFVKFWLLENRVLRRRSSTMAMLALFACLSPSNVRAGIVTAGESDAYAVFAGIKVTLAPVAAVTVTIPTQPLVGSTAPAPYSLTNSTATVTGDVIGVAGINATLLKVNASSTVDGLPGSMTAIGSSAVTGLSALVGPLGNLLSISSGSDVITETSTASGTFGSLTATGNLTIVGSSDVVIDVLGVAAVTLHAGQVIAPNTTVALTGILTGLGSITLNEQTLDGQTNGTTYAGITSSFLDLNLSPAISTILVHDSAGIDIVVDHTHASLTASAVPEPSSLVLAGLGTLIFLGTFFMRHRPV
jgi:hypothetical protein